MTRNLLKIINKEIYVVSGKTCNWLFLIIWPYEQKKKIVNIRIYERGQVEIKQLIGMNKIDSKNFTIQSVQRWINRLSN